MVCTWYALPGKVDPMYWLSRKLKMKLAKLRIFQIEKKVKNSSIEQKLILCKHSVIKLNNINLNSWHTY